MLRALTVLRHNQTQKLSFAQATNATMRIARRRRTRTLEKKKQKEKVQDLLLANKHVIAEEKKPPVQERLLPSQFRTNYCFHCFRHASSPQTKKTRPTIDFTAGALPKKKIQFRANYCLIAPQRPEK